MCFVFDFAPKKRKRVANLLKHIAFLLMVARFWIRASLKKPSSGRAKSARRW